MNHRTNWAHLGWGTTLPAFLLGGMLLLWAHVAIQAESLFSDRPTVGEYTAAVDLGTWCAKALEERKAVIGQPTSYLPAAASQSNRLAVLKAAVKAIVPYFVDTTQMGGNGTFNQWFADHPEATTFPMLTPTGLCANLGIPTNFFDYTPWRTSPDFEDYGSANLHEALKALKWTRTAADAGYSLTCSWRGTNISGTNGWSWTHHIEDWHKDPPNFDNPHIENSEQHVDEGGPGAASSYPGRIITTNGEAVARFTLAPSNLTAHAEVYTRYTNSGAAQYDLSGGFSVYCDPTTWRTGALNVYDLDGWRYLNGTSSTYWTFGWATNAPALPADGAWYVAGSDNVIATTSACVAVTWVPSEINIDRMMELGPFGYSYTSNDNNWSPSLPGDIPAWHPTPMYPPFEYLYAGVEYGQSGKLESVVTARIRAEDWQIGFISPRVLLKWTDALNYK